MCIKYAYIYTHECTYISTQKHTCVDACMWMHVTTACVMHGCLDVYMHVCTYVCLHVPICLQMRWMHLCVNTCTWSYIAHEFRKPWTLGPRGWPLKSYNPKTLNHKYPKPSPLIPNPEALNTGFWTFWTKHDYLFEPPSNSCLIRPRNNPFPLTRKPPPQYKNSRPPEFRAFGPAIES